MKTAMPSATGVAMSERQDRGIERPPDERQRAEFAGHRIPGLRAPEVEAELLDRQPRLPGQLDADARTTMA